MLSAYGNQICTFVVITFCVFSIAWISLVGLYILLTCLVINGDPNEAIKKEKL